MNTKNFLIGGIVGGVVFFFLGWLIYGNLFQDFFAKNSGYGSVAMSEFKWWALILGNLFSGFLLAYVLTKAGVISVSSGLITGGILGFFISGSADLIMFSTSKMLNRNSLMVDVACYTIMFAIAGAVVAAVIGMSNRVAVKTTAV